MKIRFLFSAVLSFSLFLLQVLHAQGLCGDVGVENGWSSWKAATGVYFGGVVTLNATNLIPTAPRFNLTSGAGLDGCTPGPNPNDPPLQLVAPGFGNASIQLGHPKSNGYDDGCSAPYPTMAGGCVEQLTYALTVTPQDTNFLYAYAVVLENPTNVPHSANDVPFAEIYMRDQNGDTISCSYHKYTGSINATGVIPPGMYAASCAGPVVAGYGPNGNDVAYSPWSVNGLSLKNYVGQTITIVLTNADCGRSGHFCHSYWDFSCATTVVSSGCKAQSSSFCAPAPTPGNSYTYQWYQNGNTYSGPNSTSQCIVPTSQAGDTFSVKIHQISGCDFWMKYVPQPMSVVAAAGPNSTICAGQPITINASGGGNYSWSNGQTTSSITCTPLATANYSVVVSSGGCLDTAFASVTVIPSPIALVSPTTVCIGQSAILTASGGGNYLWSNGSTASVISVTATATATYSVIVSAGGCSDTTSGKIFITPSPVVDLGNDQTICSGQNFTLDAGNPGVSYIWSTGATTQTISVSGAGTYWIIVGMNNCLATDTIKTFIAPNIHLQDSSLCVTSPIVLDAGAGASSYLWSNGAVTQSIAVEASGSYWVTAMFGSCPSGDTAKITGEEGAGSLYVPNAFTPNDDNLNEVFLAKGTGIVSFNMSVFDRWGNLIFASDDVNKGWDGKIEGGHYIFKQDGQEVSQEDVYVWKIDYTTQCFPLVRNKLMGHVSIVK